MSNLRERIKASFTDLNSDPWFPELTSALVAQKWIELRADTNLSPESYGTTRILRRSVDAPRYIIAVVNGQALCCAQRTFVEYADPELAASYKNAGVTFYSIDEIQTSSILRCLADAFNLLGYVDSVRETVEALVRSLHVIKPRDIYHDISFSEPYIPFSIFVSIAKQRYPGDAVRLAEAVLHEAMHLQLTLVESIAPLLKRTSNRYFSPWRGEMRDASGILHGLYVFTVVARFLGKLQTMSGLDQFSLEHIERRRTEIRGQILQLETFRTSSDVTTLGMLLRHHLFRT